MKGKKRFFFTLRLLKVLKKVHIMCTFSKELCFRCKKHLRLGTLCLKHTFPITLGIIFLVWIWTSLTVVNLDLYIWDLTFHLERLLFRFWIHRESEYAAWTLVNGYALNHVTISTHQLKSHLRDIKSLNQFIEENGFKLNSEGGVLKGLPPNL